MNRTLDLVRQRCPCNPSPLSRLFRSPGPRCHHRYCLSPDFSIDAYNVCYPGISAALLGLQSERLSPQSLPFGTPVHPARREHAHHLAS